MKKNEIVKFEKVTKTFLGGKIVANKDVSFAIQEGEVHAIAGENGAGKSTLLSMLFGLYKPSSGKIFVKGKEIKYKSAADAMKDGLGMVQQHFQLVEKFSVGENILLGKEPSKYGFKSFGETFKKINEISKKYKFGIKAKQKIKNLTVGQQQKTEILKLLFSDSEILIFDEPTAMLIPEEIDELLDVIKKLKAQGKTIIIITHKLDEIKAIADNVTVIRKGKFQGTLSSKKITSKSLSQLMVGREVVPVKKKDKKPGEVLLKLENLSFKNKTKLKLDDFSLEVRAGEIVSVAGVEGNGQSELANIILGLIKANKGNVFATKDGELKNINKLSISQRNDILSSISEDRHKYGTVLDMKVYENMTLKNFWKDYSRFGMLNKKKMYIESLETLNKFDVRGANGGKAPMRGLSGGNQQKAVVGREIDSDKDIMIIFQATRGLDVGAIEYIHQQILKAREAGKAILMISYDLNEVLALSDKVAVINGGKLTGLVSGKDINRTKVGVLMSSGGKK